MLTAQLALLVVLSWQLGFGETFSLGLFDDMSLTGVEVEQLVLPSTLLEITSRKAPEVQHQADKTM